MSTAVDQYLSVRGSLQEIQAPDKSRLSGAGHADDSVYVTLLDREIDITQRVDLQVFLLEGLRQVFYFDHTHMFFLSELKQDLSIITDIPVTVNKEIPAGKIRVKPTAVIRYREIPAAVN